MTAAATPTPAEVKAAVPKLIFALLMLGLGLAFPVWAIVQLAAHGPNPFMIAFVVLSASALVGAFARKSRIYPVISQIDRLFDMLVIAYFSYQLIFVGVTFASVLWLATFLFTFTYRMVQELRGKR